MPAYGTPKPGYNQADPGKNLAALYPGEPLTLLAGTEEMVQGDASVAFVRAMSISMNDGGTTFDAHGMTAADVIDVEAANVDDDDYYFSVGSISPDANGNGGFTDVGRSCFYRVKLTTLNGDVPEVIAQR